MNISDNCGKGPFPSDVAVVVAVLPELLVQSSQLARSDLLDGFEKLRQQDLLRLVDEQVNMFRHQNVSVNSCPVASPGLFQHHLNRFLGGRRPQQRMAVIATEGDEVQRLRLLIPF